MTIDPYEYPRLRWPLEMRMEELQGRQVLVFRCPLGVADKPLALIAAVAPIVASFDGTASIKEITDKFSSLGVEEKLVRDLVAILDQHLFLVSPVYESAERVQREEFSRLTVRPAALSGGGYAANAEKLSEEIDACLAQASPNGKVPQGRLLGLIAPHIDYRRGGASYGKTYSALKGHKHDVYVLLGTAHQYSSRLFHLTLKDFATPLGVMCCEREFVQKLAGLYGAERGFADEVLHKKEHSLELQLPFVARLMGTRQIVPVLIGGFHSMINSGKLPSEFEEYESFAAALAECVQEWTRRGKSVCLIAGADMAHVGRFFGGSTPLTQDLMSEIRVRDLAYLDLLMAQDKKGLLAHMTADKDARRVCGFPAVYTFLDIFDRLSLRYQACLLSYDQAVDYRSDCAVTFAGLGMYSPLVP